MNRFDDNIVGPISVSVMCLLDTIRDVDPFLDLIVLLEVSRRCLLFIIF